MPSKKGESHGGQDPAAKQSEDRGEDQTRNSVTIKITLPRWCAWSGAILVGIAAILLGAYKAVQYKNDIEMREMLEEEMGSDGMMMFAHHDRDGDGYLSLEEFEPFAHLLRGTNFTHEEYEVPIDTSGEIVTVTALFKPVLYETMTKDIDDIDTGGVIDSLAGLHTWKKPFIEWMNFGISEFAAFLPTDHASLTSVGVPYDIVVFRDARYFGGPLSSNRYYPLRVSDSEVLFHRLLSMFHKRPFLVTRFAPQGSIACVRAYNDEYVDIVFRIHAEFQLNEPPFHPFWYTPGQFTGNLIIKRDLSKLMHFHLYVPTEKGLNVDMEWLNGAREADSMEVDIGFMPQMELRITSPSHPAVSEQGHDLTRVRLPEDTDMEAAMRDIVWTEQVSLEEARRNIEVKFYKFKEVPYHHFADAYSLAGVESKLVHFILLWGALDDQSC